MSKTDRMETSDQVVEKLIAALGPEIILQPEEARLRPASHWRGHAGLICKALALPRTTADVIQIMRICHAYDQAVVPHGGLTNVVGGTVTTSREVAMSLERLNVIEEIDEINQTVTVQAGVVLAHLQQKAASHGLLFPVDLGAKGSCMIGGNIASNAGGLQALRYGVMRQQVLGLEVVLADGTLLSNLRKLSKDNTGYDLKHLFIGSEGTLGIITRAVLTLHKRPSTRQTAFVALPSFNRLHQFLRLAQRRLRDALTTFEVFWQDYYVLMTTPPDGFPPPLPRHYPFYVLLEALGEDPAEDHKQFEQLLAEGLEQDLLVDAVPAQTNQEWAWFWSIREKVELVFSRHHPVFMFDISLPINVMDEYIHDITEALKSRWAAAVIYTFGHLGDGNLHLYVCCGEADERTRALVDEIVLSPLSAFGGSISAEHGIGLEKKKWLYLSRSPAEMEVMRSIKRVLDPKNILNPGKMW